MKKNIVLLLITPLFILSCQEKYQYAFQNPDLTPEQRAKDLVSRLTLEEKVAQMLNNAPAIDSLGIPAYDWWNECLHGVGRTKYKVTVYPQAIGMAAGWDKQAMKIMADYTAEEGRAVYNLSSAEGDRSIYNGLTYWTPNINIFRDPRWGRGQETYGEDPYLTGMLGMNFVEGLQSEDSGYLKAAACAKHFAVHSGPEDIRHSFDVTVSDYDLWDTYLPAFRDLIVDAKVAGVMCAYNRYAGEPCCASNLLMMDILRNQWKFTGYVTSDCGAIDDFLNHHKTHPTVASSAADAVIHGTDLECGRNMYVKLVEAVHEGLITEEQIDISVQRLFEIRFRLGLLDPVERVPYSKIDSSALEKDIHTAHALKMAQQSIVLLKNENNTLPLSRNNKKIAVLGPNANNKRVLLGNYEGTPSKVVSVLEGIKQKVGDGVEIYYEPVMTWTKELDAMKTISDKTKDADVILFIGGISPEIEGEEMPVDEPGFYKGDRTTIALPEVQTNFMKMLKATGKPVVFVMMSGSAIGIPWESENIPAILSTWYAGQSGGTAIADVLFGDYNPSGRLPVTFYAKDEDLPHFHDFDMDNRTYRYFKGKPLYAFGHGLSYTTFSYEWESQPAKEYSKNAIIHCNIKVRNTGDRTGDEVAQVYIQYPQGGPRLPLKELRTFERLSIDKGDSAEFNISIRIDDLKKWDETTEKFEVPAGTYRIFAGGSSDDERISDQFEIK